MSFIYFLFIQEEKEQDKEKEGKWWKRELIEKIQF